MCRRKSCRPSWISPTVTLWPCRWSPTCTTNVPAFISSLSRRPTSSRSCWSSSCSGCRDRRTGPLWNSCALVRVTTESVLAEMCGLPDVNELFEWLRGLSFIQTRPGGLFPHDLAREAMVADLRWRNPEWYAELHRRARLYLHPAAPANPRAGAAGCPVRLCLLASR